MNTNNQGDNLSPEEIEVNTIISDTTLKMREFEDRIGGLPAERKPVPMPGGMVSGKEPGDVGKQKFFYQQQIKALEMEANETLDRIVGNSTLDTQLKLHKTIDEWRNPNKELDERTWEQKTITGSQDLAMRRVEEAKEKLTHSKPIRDAEVPVKTADAKSENKLMSISTKFSQSLKYNRLDEMRNPAYDEMEKSSEVDLNVKPMSISSRFAQSLGYNSIEPNHYTDPEIEPNIT